MQKLIATIYFYIASLIGLVILIIGIFASIHFLVGITVYKEYPLGYSTEARCNIPAPAIDKANPQPVQSTQAYTQCVKEVEQDRIARKADDAEKALSFTIVGLLVFCLHFYYARKQK